MKKFVFAAAFACLATIIAGPGSANDSSASIGLGGLELTPNDAISMDSEDLYLSRDVVRVTYRFTNTSAKDFETLVSFPLPAIPDGIDGHMGDQGYPNWKDDLNFQTLVDGQPVTLTYYEVVSIIGRPDIKNAEVRLKELNWPVHFWQDYDFEQKYIAKLSDGEKAALVQNGLLRRNADSDYHMPNWQVQAHVTRMQTFPAGKTITVEHSYKPVVGGSVSGMM